MVSPRLGERCCREGSRDIEEKVECCQEERRGGVLTRKEERHNLQRLADGGSTELDEVE